MSKMDNIFALSNISEEAQQMLDKFWKRHAQSIRNTTTIDFKTQELPLARIKKIMKLDEDVKMIAGEAPVLFAKAVEIFIAELSLRAWVNTEQNKRRTLQRSDIAMAIAKYDQFDFLIDIVPREEAKPMKKDDINNLSALDPYNNYYIQALPPGTQLLQASNQSPPFSLSPQIFQVPVPSSSQNNRENRSQVSSPVPPLPITLSSQQYQALIQNQRQNSGQNQQEILLNQPTSFALSTNSGQVVQTIISTSSKTTSNSTKVVINNNKNKKKLS